MGGEDNFKLRKVTYQVALRTNQLDVVLYLALPLTAYQRVMGDLVIRQAFQSIGVKIVVVNIETEEVVRWRDSLD